jgi:hypothetical protein
MAVIPHDSYDRDRRPLAGRMAASAFENETR